MQPRPSAAQSLLILSLFVLFLWLGFWQLDRMQAKQNLFDSFEQAPELHLQQAIENEVVFARIRTSGAYDQSWHLLLDNKTL